MNVKKIKEITLRRQLYRGNATLSEVHQLVRFVFILN